MKKIVILTGALVALTAGIATAGGINLAWNDCGTNGVSLRTFSCANNAGTNLLFGSFLSPVPLDSMNGNEMVLDMQTSGPVLSPWWQVKNSNDPIPTVACRNGAASISFDFTAGSGLCADFWNGQALGGLGILTTGPNRQRMLGICAVVPDAAGPVAAETETYSFRIAINNTKSTGAGSCGGCTDGALIVFNSIKLTQNVGVPGDDRDKTISNSADANFVSFQNVLPGAPGPTATKNTTWGAVKSLYRN